jgi:hypothetical protein
VRRSSPKRTNPTSSTHLTSPSFAQFSSQNEFDKVGMRLGTREEAAIQRMNSVTREELQSIGVTEEMAGLDFTETSYRKSLLTVASRRVRKLIDSAAERRRGEQ